jgi:hypothetical protein
MDKVVRRIHGQRVADARQATLMRSILLSVIVTSTLSVVELGQTQENSSSETIVLDGFPIAFYDVAPRRLAASMQRAVVVECAMKRQEAVSAEVVAVREWLCDGLADTFFRAVDTQSRGMVIGHVCQGDWGLKWVATSTLANAETRAECVAMSYGSIANTHILELRPAGNGIRRRVRAACASVHCARTADWAAQRAAAELRR